MEIIAGRDFDEKSTMDTAYYIINETAAKEMGMENPVGESISGWWGSPHKIIG